MFNAKMLKENLIKAALFLCAISSIGIVFFIVAYMLWLGYPEVSTWIEYGFKGFTAFIYNTMYVGIGGTLLGAAIGIPCAIYLAEFADMRIRNMIKPTLEVLNGFPSVVLGMVGYAIVCFTIERYTGGTATGSFYCILAAWIVLGIMSLPLIASVSEDSIRAVPQDLREASLGLGATKWQTALRVLIPSAMSGILTALLLALGNAIGETMAVLAVIGVETPPPITLNPLVSSNVITAMIANGYEEVSWGSVSFDYLFAAGFILFVMTMLLNIATRTVVSGQNRNAGSGGTNL
ncbi:MAG TPA: phosphate ABC transporter permease subunit PstC [Candidatus Limnocylindrales bacterium]|nr:phosphate ABC transporter permease subunit PstC [Candidatus Limnocylindrales bacterium]